MITAADVRAAARALKHDIKGGPTLGFTFTDGSKRGTLDFDEGLPETDALVEALAEQLTRAILVRSIPAPLTLLEN